MEKKLFNKDYILLTQGALFSTFGYVLYSAAVSYWVYEETGSTALMGTLAGISMFVRMFLSPIAGTITDSLSRRNFIAGSDAVCGVCFTVTGILALTGRLSVPVIAAAAMVAGLCGSFLNPASTSLLADIVPKEHFIRGQSILDGGRTLLDLIGQACSGVLIVALGAPLLILINGICYFISALTEIFIHNYPSHNAGKEMNLKTVWKDFLSNGAFFGKDRALLALGMVIVLANLFCGGAFNLLVAFTLDNGMTTEQYGYMGAAISLGGMLGMLYVGAKDIPAKKRFPLMTTCFLLATLLDAAAFWIARFVPSCILFLVGMSFNGLANGLLGGCLTLMMPEERRGSMSGFLASACLGGTALSGVLYGLISEAIPIRMVCVAGSVLGVIPMVMCSFNRELKRKIEEI